MRRSISVRLMRRALRLWGLTTPWIELPPGAVIVAPNHQSLLDGPLLACVTDRPMLFGVDPDWCCRQPWRAALALCSWLGIGDVVALDTRKPFAWRRLAAALREGRAVCIFPEGGIARGSERLPIQPGVARLARLVGAPVLPVCIDGSRARVSSARSDRVRPPLTLAAADSISPTHDQLESVLADALVRSAVRSGSPLPAAAPDTT